MGKVDQLTGIGMLYCPQNQSTKPEEALMVGTPRLSLCGQVGLGMVRGSLSAMHSLLVD
jgi:hypothetical protein